MFKKWASETESIAAGGNGDKSDKYRNDDTEEARVKINNGPADAGHRVEQKTNTILKGSTLKGDIVVTSDLELSGDVEGNIRSDQDSNIILRGNCKGNIETKEGSVNIDGSLEGGNINAGKDVTISGKFNGGEVKAGIKIYVNGEFNGKLEANEIEIGSNAVGNGELHYGEYISIDRGAKVQVQISQTQPRLKVVEKSPAKKVVDNVPEKIESKEA